MGELSDLRSLNVHLLRRVINVQKQNQNDDENANPDATVNEQRQNDFYQNVLKEVDHLHKEYPAKQKQTSQRILILNEKIIKHDQLAVDAKNSYKNFRRKICKKTEKIKWILQREQDEEALDAQIEQQRLKNLHFGMEESKMRKAIKKDEMLSDGLHFIH